MHTYNKSIIVAMGVLMLLAGCGQVAVTPVPPTTTSPSSTPASVRVTVVVTATPTPTPANTAEPGIGTVLLIFGDRFISDIYTAVRPAFEEAGYDVVVASRTMEPLQGKNVNLKVEVDLLLEDVQVEDYDAILFNCDNDITFGSARAETDRIAQEAVEQGKVLAAICSGPRVLAYAEVVEGVTTTGEPSQTCQMLEQSGATCTGADIERDGLIITARDRYSSRAYVQAIIEAMQEQSVAPTARAKRLREWADLRPGQGPVYSQDWSPDDRWLVTADYDQIKVWDIESRREAGVLVGHSSFVWGLAWSPDGSVLASASQDGSVRLWDVSAYTETAVLETGWRPFCVVWSPDGSRLAVGNDAGLVQIWDVATEQLLDFWQSAAGSLIISIAWSPDGKTIASGEWGGGIYLWDVETGQVRTSFTGYTTDRCDVNGLAWSPDGSTLASAHQDGQMRLWNVETGNMVRAIEAHAGWVRGVAWSPSGHLLASTGEDKRICLWDPETGQAYAEEHHNRLPVWSVSWSPDGTQVASGAGGYEQQHVGATIVWTVP